MLSGGLLASCSKIQLDLKKGMMDCLYAECIPCITDCVMAELEKLGEKYRVALKVAKVTCDKSCLSARSDRMCQSAPPSDHRTPASSAYHAAIREHMRTIAW